MTFVVSARCPPRGVLSDFVRLLAPVTYEDDVGVSDGPWRWVGDSRLQAAMAKQVNIGMVSPRVDFAMLTGVMTSKSC